MTTTRWTLVDGSGPVAEFREDAAGPWVGAIDHLQAQAEAHRRIADLAAIVRRLVDVMYRSDAEQFSDEPPVTSDEWFEAIEQAEAFLAAAQESKP